MNILFLVDYSFDNAGNQVKTAKTGHDDKNQLSQCRELWLFWYGEKPEQLKNLLNPSLKVIFLPPIPKKAFSVFFII